VSADVRVGGPETPRRLLAGIGVATVAAVVWLALSDLDRASALLFSAATVVAAGAVLCLGRAVQATPGAGRWAWAGRALGLGGAAIAIAFPALLYAELTHATDLDDVVWMPRAFALTAVLVPVTVVPALVALRWTRAGGLLFLGNALVAAANTVYDPFGAFPYRDPVGGLVFDAMPRAFTAAVLLIAATRTSDGGSAEASPPRSTIFTRLVTGAVIASLLLAALVPLGLTLTREPSALPSPFSCPQVASIPGSSDPGPSSTPAIPPPTVAASTTPTAAPTPPPPPPTVVPTVVPSPAPTPSRALAALQQDMAELIERYPVPGRYAVAVTDLASGETASVNGDRPQLSGCSINYFLLLQVTLDLQDGRYPLARVDALFRETTWSSNATTALELYRIAGSGDALAGVARVDVLIRERLGLVNTVLNHPPAFASSINLRGGDNWLSANDANAALASLWRGDGLTPEWRAYLLERLSTVEPGLGYLTGSIPDAVISHKNGFFWYSGGYVDNDNAIVRPEGRPDDAFAISFLSEEVRVRYADLPLARDLIELAASHFSSR